jgi:hypothetical protein
MRIEPFLPTNMSRTMTIKMWIAAVLAVGLAGSGAAALKLTRGSADCCYEGSPCCYEGSACCLSSSLAAAALDCCFEGSPCCEAGGSACCTKAKAAPVKVAAKKTPDCCYEGSPCCAAGDCCLTK